MTYIESHQELARHPKTRKLARLLRCSIPTAIGHLHLLWWWCMDFADDGDITRYEAADIADAMLWEGDADELLCDLIQSGFVDRCEEENEQALVIHDWWDYAGMLVKRREANRERMRAARAKPELTPTPEPDKSVSSRAKNVQRTPSARAGATVPNRTQPEPTQPDHEEEADRSSFAPKAADAAPSPESQPTPSEKPRPINPFWDALVAGIGHDATPSKKGAWGKAIHDLKAMNATPQEIILRCEIHRARWPDMTLTATSLAANWHDLAPDATATSPPKGNVAPMPNLAQPFQRPRSREPEKIAS